MDDLARAEGGEARVADRVEKARAILDENYEDSDIESNVVDLLADLRHFCEAEDVNFHEAADTSYMHYLAEFTGT